MSGPTVSGSSSAPEPTVTIDPQRLRPPEPTFPQLTTLAPTTAPATTTTTEPNTAASSCTARWRLSETDFVDAEGVARSWHIHYREGVHYVGFCVDGDVVDQVGISSEGTVYYATDIDGDGNAEAWLGGTAVSWGGAEAWTAVDHRVVPIMLGDTPLTAWSGFQSIVDEDGAGVGERVGMHGCADQRLTQTVVDWRHDEAVITWSVTTTAISGASAGVDSVETGELIVPGLSDHEIRERLAELAESLTKPC